MNQYTAQPVYNKKGKIVSGSIKIQSAVLEPGAKYQITLTKIQTNEKIK